MTNDQVNSAVRSAKITADAYQEIVPLYITVESESHGAGGRIFHCRTSEGNLYGTQPIRQIASVIPFTLLYA